MTPTTATGLLTAEEFFELPDPPDGAVQELVRGRVVTMPSPGYPHGRVCARVMKALILYLAKNEIGDLTCNDAGVRTERGPDIAFWTYDRLPPEDRPYPAVPPSLVIEVQSPSDSHSRTASKVDEYLAAGVAVVWVVDPEFRVVRSYRMGDEPGGAFSRKFEEDDILDGNGLLPGLGLRVGDLFDRNSMPPDSA